MASASPFDFEPERPITPHEFAEQFGAVSRSLWTLAAGIAGDASDADDAVQEAALLAFQRRAQFRRGTNFAGWLATFVRHVVNNAGRKRTRRATHAVDPDSFAGLADEARAPIFAIDERGALREGSGAFDDEVSSALSELAPDARACLLLRVVLEHSYAEIAAILALPEGTVASHVHRARAALRERLQHEARVTRIR
ncbi:MAG: RNA polymerase sigma factor [Planctomycetota bacterium]